MRRSFPRSLSSLDAVFDFAEAFASEHGIVNRAFFLLRLVVEELFINLLRHNKSGGSEIAISLDRRNDRLHIGLEDFQIPVFTPFEIPIVDNTKPLRERRIGGLGLHIVNQVVDDLVYDYRDETMIVTAVMDLGE